MKGVIHYIESDPNSVKQSKESFQSFTKYGWDVTLQPGITPETLDLSKVPPIKEMSRLHGYKKESENRYLTKLSCAMNHLRHWKRVIEKNEPMAFLEHDSICIEPWSPTYILDECLILNAEYAFKPPTILGKMSKFSNFEWPATLAKKSVDLPSDYPLLYYKKNDWEGSFMIPGTAAYLITPKGAKKMLAIAEKTIDQSDFMINSKNVHLQYATNSPVKFNTRNLQTSHGTV